jgi:putative transposase
MVNTPADYRWSSYGRNASGEPNVLVTPHASYSALGETAALRQMAYMKMVQEQMAESECDEIRTYLQQGRALGSQRFQAYIEALHGRTACTRERGRPFSVNNTGQ